MTPCLYNFSLFIVFVHIVFIVLSLSLNASIVVLVGCDDVVVVAVVVAGIVSDIVAVDVADIVVVVVTFRSHFVGIVAFSPYYLYIQQALLPHFS